MENHRCKTVSRFIQQLEEMFQKYLIYNKIKKLNCVVGYFNVKKYRLLIAKFDL